MKFVRYFPIYQIVYNKCVTKSGWKRDARHEILLKQSLGRRMRHKSKEKDLATGSMMAESRRLLGKVSQSSHNGAREASLNNQNAREAFAVVLTRSPPSFLVC